MSASERENFSRAYNRENYSLKTLSLDAPMGGTDPKRIDLLEASAPYEPVPSWYGACPQIRLPLPECAPICFTGIPKEFSQQPHALIR